ncbi:MAG: PD-(D/E)XK nuclease family protein [Myxococcota bacterium]
MTAFHVVAAVALLAVVGIAIRVWRWWQLQPVAVVGRDDEVLRSPRLGLSGRPDRLLQLRNGAVVPIEKKSGSAKLYDDILVQVGAYLLLVEDVYGRRPPFGLVVLGDDTEYRIRNTARLRRWTRKILDKVKVQRSKLHVEGQGTPLAAKCRKCGFLDECAQGLRTIRRH